MDLDQRLARFTQIVAFRSAKGSFCGAKADNPFRGAKGDNEGVAEEITVLAVTHTARRPDDWLKRRN